MQIKTTLFDANVKLTRRTLISFFVSAGVFIFSLFFAPFYYDGDQVPYFNAYNAVTGSDFFGGFPLYYYAVNASEPLHYVIIWVASNLGFEKNLFMAIANSFLANLIMRVFLQWRVSVYVAVVVIFTNYYLLVLYFAAERLKFGFVFLMLSLLYSRQIKLSVALAITSIFSHLQQILIYGSVVFSSVMASVWYTLNTGKIGLKKTFPLIFLILTVLTLFYFLGDSLISKFSSYNGAAAGNSLFALWKGCILLLFTLRYSKARLEVVSVFAVLFLATALVGPERINMISYCFFMFYALQYKGGVNLGVAVTSFYFGLKSIQFILNVIDNGHGFS